jgi:phage shock protein C
MKRIYRLKSDKKIAGICAGIADMYTIDPMTVRIGVVFGTVATGFWPGIITYCVAWFLLPDKTELDRDDKLN